MRRILIIAACVLGQLGCAARAIPPEPGPPDAPRASWTLRVGSSGGRGTIVCRSDVEEQCVIPLQREGREVTAAVSVYLYAAGGKTTYTGWFFSSFLSDTGYESVVKYDADPEAQPTLMSHYGPVVVAPGSYEFRLALTATVGEGGAGRPFDLVVPVRIAPVRAE